LAKGANVNAVDANRITALQSLDHGADPNTHAGNGFTALMNAASSGNIEMVRLLIARKADVNAVSAASIGTVKNGSIAIGYMTPLHWAVINGGPAMGNRC